MTTPYNLRIEKVYLQGGQELKEIPDYFLVKAIGEAPVFYGKPNALLDTNFLTKGFIKTLLFNSSKVPFIINENAESIKNFNESKNYEPLTNSKEYNRILQYIKILLVRGATKKNKTSMRRDTRDTLDLLFVRNHAHLFNVEKVRDNKVKLDILVTDTQGEDLPHPLITVYKLEARRYVSVEEPYALTEGVHTQVVISKDLLVELLKYHNLSIQQKLLSTTIELLIPQNYAYTSMDLFDFYNRPYLYRSELDSLTSDLKVLFLSLNIIKKRGNTSSIQSDEDIRIINTSYINTEKDTYPL